MASAEMGKSKIEVLKQSINRIFFRTVALPNSFQYCKMSSSYYTYDKWNLMELSKMNFHLLF